MNFTQLLEVFLGRWKVIAMAFMVFAIGATAVTLLLPKKYTATASILVDAKGGDALGAATAAQSPNQVVMTTQADLIGSERVARRAVAILKWDADPEWRRSWQEDGQGKGELVNYIARGLLPFVAAKPSRDSNVMDISYTGRDAAQAARVVNAFAQATIETNLELKVEPAKLFTGWFDERTKGLRKNLETAQERLTAYQREKGLVTAGEGRIDIENAKLAQLAAQLVQIQESRAESSSRQAQAKSDARTSPDVINNGVIATLRGALNTAETNLTQLRTQYGEQHPLVANGREQVQTLRAQLEKEMQAVARSLTTNNSVNEQRETAARAALEAQRARVLSMMNETTDAVVLQRDVESAQRALEVATTRQSQTLLESQVQQTNVFFLTSADEPDTPSRPRVFINIASGAAFGLLVGLALALWLEARTPLIRNAEDLLALVELPVLASLPRIRGLEKPRDVPRLPHHVAPS